MCLIGRNGAGKSTLLKIISGEQAYDRGVLKRRNGLRIAKLAQALPAALEMTVADFVGEGVFLIGTVVDASRVETALGVLGKVEELHGFPLGSKVTVLIRPDDVIHDDASTTQARVIDKAFRGAGYLYTLALPDGSQILSLAPSHHAHAEGEMIGIHIEMDHLVAFSAR